MPETLMVYRISVRTFPSLKDRFPNAFPPSIDLVEGTFMVETPNPEIQLIMTEEALLRNFDLTEAPEDIFFSARTRTLAEYLNR